MFKVQASYLQEYIEMTEGFANYQLQGHDYYNSLSPKQMITPWEIIKNAGADDCAFLLSEARLTHFWHWWIHACLSRALSLHSYVYSQNAEKPYPTEMHKKLFGGSGLFIRALRKTTPHSEITNNSAFYKLGKNIKGRSLTQDYWGMVCTLSEEDPHGLVYSLQQLSMAFSSSFFSETIDSCTSSLAESVAALSYDDISEFINRPELRYRLLENTPEYTHEREVQKMLLKACLGSHFFSV